MAVRERCRDSGAIEGSSETVICRWFTVHVVLGETVSNFQNIKNFQITQHVVVFEISSVSFKIYDCKILQSGTLYTVQKYTQIHFLNEIFHSKALTGIIVFLSCSYALNLLNICVRHSSHSVRPCPHSLLYSSYSSCTVW